MLSQSSWSSVQRRTIVRFCIQACVLALIAAAFFVRIPHVAGISMAPQISSGEVVLVDTIAFRLRRVQRSDIIAFKHDRSEPAIYLKRVIAIPGDRIRIDRGTVVLNGRPLAEPYVRYRDSRSSPEETVPAESYYVLGDNRAQSDDSRRFGTVPADLVVGRALFGLWPLQRLGAL